MPLIHSKSPQAFKKNAETLLHEAKHGTSKHIKSRDQALAVAYKIKREGRADGGHVGPIISTVPGRTDHHPIDVPSGSYILPAECVSHLGENNTNAGLKRLHDMGPQGFKRMVGGSAKSVKTAKSKGGKVDGSTGQPVPINAAGGEFVVPPSWVTLVGGGDIKRGHAIIDHWVMENRKKHIATLKKLPGPAQD